MLKRGKKTAAYDFKIEAFHMLKRKMSITGGKKHRISKIELILLFQSFTHQNVSILKIMPL